jgi:hypothetical protein
MGTAAFTSDKFAFFNLSTGTVGTTAAGTTATITAIGDGYYRCTIRATSAVGGLTAGGHVRIGQSDGVSSFAGDGTSGIFVARTDLRPTNIHAAGSIPAYQRVLDPETYDSVGFSYRFIPNGTGQAFQTSTITPGSDSVTVVSGIRKLSDATTQAVMELTNGTGVDGAMLVLAPNSGGLNTIGWAPRGTVAQPTLTQSSLIAPITTTVIAKAVISTDERSLAVNNGTPVTSALDMGTGNFATAALNIFSRNSASIWFGGQGFRQFVCFGPALSAGEVATVESWVNESAKAY